MWHITKLSNLNKKQEGVTGFSKFSSAVLLQQEKDSHLFLREYPPTPPCPCECEILIINSMLMPFVGTFICPWWTVFLAAICLPRDELYVNGMLNCIQITSLVFLRWENKVLFCQRSTVVPDLDRSNYSRSVHDCPRRYGGCLWGQIVEGGPWCMILWGRLFLSCS